MISESVWEWIESLAVDECHTHFEEYRKTIFRGQAYNITICSAFVSHNYLAYNKFEIKFEISGN